MPLHIIDNRRIHLTFGFVCPVESSEGEQAGIMKDPYDS